MMKKILFYIFICIFNTALSNYAIAEDFADDMDFDNFAIVDDEGSDINLESVELNADSTVVAVDKFDISGIMLGMTFEEIQNLFFNSSALYAPSKKNSVVYTMNKDWKYNLDYECRQNNIFVPESLNKCIYSLARNRGLLYVSEVHLVRDYTGETIDVFFTSNATNNVVWKVVYKNDVNTVDGTSEKFTNQREKKILAFWQGVLDKYGAP
ncbi:MAG: hypothetical protein MJ156_02000, partial [Alphaproteobacteria bacterium]|nr:hypothetical protein [Alphaproteobacteria bacterium]